MGRARDYRRPACGHIQRQASPARPGAERGNADLRSSLTSRGRCQVRQRLPQREFGDEDQPMTGRVRVTTALPTVLRTPHRYLGRRPRPGGGAWP